MTVAAVAAPRYLDGRVVEELQSLDGLASDLLGRARARGVYLIGRFQARKIARVLAVEGRTEDASLTTVSGQGLQVLTDDGRTAQTGRDDFDPARALELLDRAVAAASDGERLRLDRLPRPDHLPVERALAVPPEGALFDAISLEAVRVRLLELEREIEGRVPGAKVRLSYVADLDAWRIVRSDGTDVLFAMPRCTLRASATGTAATERHTVGAAVSSPWPDLPWDAAAVSTFLKRAEHAARLATELPDAPPHPAGSFPLVMDYALAKGLAHEAFGHAAEADGYRASVLASEGRLKVGEPVGAPHVSVVDEPVVGDHAWQPYSANGLPRLRVRIVDRGRLLEGLSDPWSYKAGGIPLSGACRAESFRHAPLPRMSNIRIEVEDPLPAPGDFEDYTPERLRDLLGAAGVFRRHPRVTFLSGYGGGQVNTASGDFAFNCKAIHEIGLDRIRLHRPAILAGSMFGALSSVREAFGPLLLDAIGTCGKWGQSVPSSGGSHYFLVLDPHPSVRLGGR